MEIDTAMSQIDPILAHSAPLRKAALCDVYAYVIMMFLVP